MKGTTHCWRESESSFLENLKPHATWILLRLLLSLWILWLNVNMQFGSTCFFFFFFRSQHWFPAPSTCEGVHWPYIDGVGAYLHNEADVEAALKAAGYQAGNATRCHQSSIVSLRMFSTNFARRSHARTWPPPISTSRAYLRPAISEYAPDIIQENSRISRTISSR